jgi:hypothetical protein
VLRDLLPPRAAFSHQSGRRRGHGLLTLRLPCGNISRHQDNAASVRCGFEPGSERGLLELLCDGSHDGEIHAADQFRVFSGQRIEGTVAQHDGACRALCFVPVLGQSLAGASEKSLGAWSRTGGCSGLVCDAAAPASPRGFQGVGGGGVLRGRIIDSAGQQLSREVVSAFRQGHRKLSAGSGVQLGRTARPRASTLGEPLEVDVEQAFVGKFVEVELRSVTSDAERVGGLVSTDRRGLGAHVEVEVASDWVGECRDARHAPREIIPGHGCRLSKI